MLRAQVFLWAYILIFFPASVVAQGLGVNWGVIASHPLDPKIVVNILKDNGIKKVKLFHAEHDILTALSGTDIEVMVGIPNHSLESLSEKYSVAQAWVKANITAYMGKKGVNFKYVAVGNEPFLAAYNGTYNNLTLPAMKNILKALNEAGVGKDIKLDAQSYPSTVIIPRPKLSRACSHYAAGPFGTNDLLIDNEGLRGPPQTHLSIPQYPTCASYQTSRNPIYN
ncbi:hypothetical protein GOBAR_DD24328 [Gossypium barbadense]|nr:hypothetical protein GOBAR_DD24328 [Gossypium barbadense]